MGMDWSVAAGSLRGGPLVKGGERPVFFVFIQKSLLCGNDISHVHVKVLKGRKTRGEIAYLQFGEDESNVQTEALSFPRVSPVPSPCLSLLASFTH